MLDLLSVNCDFSYVNDSNFFSQKKKTGGNAIVMSNINRLNVPIKVNNLAFKYVIEGKEDYYIGQKKVGVTARTYLLVNPSDPLLEVDINSEQTKAICINLEEDLINNALHLYLNPNLFEEDYKENLWSPDLWNGLNIADKNIVNQINLLEPNKNAEEYKAWLYDFIPLLLNNHHQQLSYFYKLKVEKKSTRLALFEKIQQSKALLRDSIYEPIKIKEIAKEIGLSEFRFYRVFKMCYGISPLQYFINCKMEKALELKIKGFSWTEVSNLLNFTDVSAFNHAFHKFYGMNPRKKLK